MKVIEYKFEDNIKLVGLAHEKFDKTSGVFERRIHLINPNGNKVKTVEDSQLRTKDGSLCLHGTDSQVKCYQKYFVVETRKQVCTMSEQDSVYYTSAYDYQGKLLGKYQRNWNQKDSQDLESQIEA